MNNNPNRIIEENPLIEESGRKQYQKIENPMREQLVSEVLQQGYTLKDVKKYIYETAEKHNLKYSTVKGIVQVFEQQGRFVKKSQRNRKFYLRKNLNLIKVNQETGDIVINHQSDFKRVEITMGKSDSIQESFPSSEMCYQINANRDLNRISKQIFEYIREMFHMRNKILLKKSAIGYQNQSQNIINEQLRMVKSRLLQQFQIMRDILSSDLN